MFRHSISNKLTQLMHFKSNEHSEDTCTGLIKDFFRKKS